MRRFRLLLAAAAAVLLLIGLDAHPAHAAGGGEVCEEEIQALHDEGQITDAQLESAIERCQQAPNPLLPEVNEIIWGAFGFAVVFGFLWKFGLPAIKSGMNARTERIQSDLAAAEAQRTEAATILADYQAQLADARNESARIVEEARQAADEVRQSLLAKAEADAAELRAKASADVEAFKNQAMADLRGEVAALAISAAEQVVGRSLDRDANVALVESFIDQVGADR
jgi:F-type H+-transporting ATPase subunit b